LFERTLIGKKLQATYAIAVFGLSIVLGLCGQINLDHAAFFALGAC
jgi:branched-chain amino acid transport system permease protein